MIDKEHLQLLMAYNSWANRRVAEAALNCSEEACKKEVGGSFPSIWKTLVHMYWAEWIWYRRMHGQSTEAAPTSSDFDSVDSLIQSWEELMGDWKNWLDGLDESDVLRPIHYRNLQGKENKQPIWQIVSHVVNHGSYHRGQVTTLMRQVGENPIGTDMIQFFRER